MPSEGVEKVLSALMQTWPARLAKGAYSAVTLPGDVYQGNVSMYGPDGHTNPAVIDRAAEIAGLMMSGGIPMAERGALGAVGGRMTQAKQYPVAPRSEWYGDANFETTGGQMVTMSPDEFLAKARPMAVDDVARENIDDLKNHIQSGRTLDPLAIYKNGLEDGRHRAHAAKELGISSVPVLIWPNKL